MLPFGTNSNSLNMLNLRGKAHHAGAAYLMRLLWQLETVVHSFNRDLSGHEIAGTVLSADIQPSTLTRLLPMARL